MRHILHHLGWKHMWNLKSKYGKRMSLQECDESMHCMADFRKTDCDRIIAIGGGAVIDMAKDPGA